MRGNEGLLKLKWRYRIEDCDVRDRGRLVGFRAALEEWHELLIGDPEQSISNQFADMLWQDAAWRSANEARRYTKDNGPNASVAPLLGAMLDSGYVAGQVISITRLLEWSNPKKPSKGVVSLRRIVDEMKERRDLFTREVFVARDALPYDWEAVRDAEDQTRRAQLGSRGGVTFEGRATTGPIAWSASAERHSMFDRISQVNPEARSRQDGISDAFFGKIEASLSDGVFDVVREFRHKVVAHAADAFSRAQSRQLLTGVKLDEFAKAHYLLIGVYQALSVVLFDTWRGGAVPTPQFDQFEHLSAPFISTARLEQLRGFWDAHCDAREKWLTDAYREIVP